MKQGIQSTAEHHWLVLVHVGTAGAGGQNVMHRVARAAQNMLPRGEHEVQLLVLMSWAESAESRSPVLSWM